MAAIDKWYTKSYEEAKEFYDWAKDKSFITPHKVTVYIKNYIYDWNINPEYFDGKEYPIMNTPLYVDNYLYKNCPLPFIQEWLKESYSGKGYCKGCIEELEQDLTLTEYTPCTKVKILHRGLGNHPYPGCWWVEINYKDNFVRYNRDKDFWLCFNEPDDWTSTVCATNITVKSIIRKILKKWKLPKDCIVKVCGRYITDEWILKTK